MKAGKISFKGNPTPAASGTMGVGTQALAFASGVFDQAEFGVATFERECYVGVASASGNIAWPSGNKQAVSIAGSPTVLTFTNPPGACNLLLRITQATGSNTITWPNSVLWPEQTPPTLSSASGYVDIATFYYNGQNYYGMATMEFR